jgi:hypothetical protein
VANKLVVSHATTYATYAQAARTGIDIVTHAPVDKAPDSSAITHLTSTAKNITPTLIVKQVSCHE